MMLQLPSQTKHYLDSLVSSFPARKRERLEAIASHISSFHYGCDENIAENAWCRLPDRVGSMFTCQESGIYTFLLARAAGFDALLLRLENHRGLDQPHLSTLVPGRGDWDYLLSDDDVSEVRFSGKSYSIKNLSKPVTFDSVSLIPENELLSYISVFNGEDGVHNFFASGQLFSNHVIRSPLYSTRVTSLAKIHRFIRYDFNNSLFIRKTVEFPGLFLSISYDGGTHQVHYSPALDNSCLPGSVYLGELDFSEESGKFFSPGPINDNSFREQLALRFITPLLLNEDYLYGLINSRFKYSRTYAPRQMNLRKRFFALQDIISGNEYVYTDTSNMKKYVKNTDLFKQLISEDHLLEASLVAGAINVLRRDFSTVYGRRKKTLSEFVLGELGITADIPLVYK